MTPQTLTISIACRFLDRVACARLVRRATRRAGAGLLRSAAKSARVLATGSAKVDLRPADAIMYIALTHGLSPDDALYVQRTQALRLAECTAG